MSRMSELDWQLRTDIVADIQQLIDAADDSVSADFVAGLETAIAVVTYAIDARPEELKNA